MKPQAAQSQLDWRVYERIVAAVMAEEHSDLNISVTPNAGIVGRSGITRQVDVVMDVRWGDDVSGRVIVDAKCHRAKLDIKDVEQFEGMMRDCRAGHGIIVCPKGYTEGAQRRAEEAITLKILRLEQIDEFDWGELEPCSGRCAQPAANGAESGMVMWVDYLSLLLHGLHAIICIAKCDRCHNFHVWCWDCGEKFALGDEEEYRCHCDRVWVTAIETCKGDQSGLRAVHLLLSVEDQVISLDRRRLR